jgi:PAS domain S-box-containing protein
MAPKLWQQGTVLIAVPLLFELGFVFIFFVLVNAAQADAWRENRFRNLSDETNKLQMMCEDAGFALYLKELRNQTAKQEQFNQLIEQVPKQLELVESLMAQDPKQAELIPDLRAAVNGALRIMFVFESLTSQHYDLNHDWAMLFRMRSQLYASLSHFFKVVEQIHAVQESEKPDPAAEPRAQLAIQSTLVAVLVFNVALAIALALYFNRSTARRLSVLMDNAQRLSREAELNPPLSGNDELGQLDQKFRNMAAALLEANQKARAVVANAVDVICSLDSDLKFLNVNPASERVFGYSADYLLGRRFTDIVAEQDQEATLRVIKETVRADGTAHLENRIVHKDGTSKDVLWSFYWSSSEQSYFCVAHDITDRKNLERLKRDLFATISHDMRTPLMAVQVDLNLLASGASGIIPDKAQENIGDAERNVAYLISLINSLLDIERATDGKLELLCDSFELRHLVEDSLDTVKPLALKKRLEICPSTIDLPAWGDETRLKQVLVNLLSNAIKFSENGKRIDVYAKSDEEWIEVSVVDQGPGIPKEYQESIFDRFKQMDITDATLRGGSGLGLAISKAIIEQHGGQIGMNSQSGKGSRFWFKLPLSPKDSRS